MQKIEYDLPIFNDEDTVNLNEYSNLMAKAIKGQIDKFGNPLVFKGTVQTLEELNANAKSGEIYRVDNENKNYIYNGTEWVVYSDNIDLSKYQDEVNTQLTNIEQEGIIVSPTEPTENRRKVWMQKGKNLSKINEVNNISSTSNSKVRVKVKENTVYTISCKKERIEGVTITNNQAYMFRWIHCYNSNNELLETFSAIDTLSTLITSNSNSKTIVTPPNTSYIEIDFRNDNGDNNANTRAFEIMVEQNQTVTSYEPYIEPKTYILNDNNVYEEFMKKEEINYNLKNKQTNNTQGSWKPIQLDDNENFIVFIIKGSNYEDCRTIPKEVIKKYSASSPLVLKFNNTIIAQLAWNSGNMVEYIWTSGYTIEHYAY